MHANGVDEKIYFLRERPGEIGEVDVGVIQKAIPDLLILMLAIFEHFEVSDWCPTLFEAPIPTGIFGSLMIGTLDFQEALNASCPGPSPVSSQQHHFPVTDGPPGSITTFEGKIWQVTLMS